MLKKLTLILALCVALPAAAQKIDLSTQVKGALPLTSMPTVAANAIFGNATGATAAPTSLSVPSCSAAGSALKWTAASGFSCNSTLVQNIASGSTALGVAAIPSASCASVVSATATGTLTTDAIRASFNGDPTAVTGYIPATTGMLAIITYPTANTVNFKVCNNTAASVTPGAVTVNWGVAR